MTPLLPTAHMTMHMTVHTCGAAAGQRRREGGAQACHSQPGVAQRRALPFTVGIALRGRGKADTLVAEIELGVVRTHEDVSQDPQRASRRRDVKADEAGEALGLARLRHLEDVLVGREREVLAREGDRHVGHRAHLVAVDGRLAVGARKEVARLLDDVLDLACSSGGAPMA